MCKTAKCTACGVELTAETMRHFNSKLCRDCFGHVRYCSLCETVKAISDFQGKSHRCIQCTKKLSRPGEKTCRTCGVTRPAIEFPANSKDCPDCFGKKRRCASCDEVKELTDFHRVAGGVGLRRICIGCVNKYRNEEYHQRKRKCRVCGEESSDFPLRSQVCTKCYGRYKKCARCGSVLLANDFRAAEWSYCKSCTPSIDAERRATKHRTCLQCGKSKIRSEFTAFKKVCNECKSQDCLRCSMCGITKSLSEFGERNSKNALGFAKRCRACVRQSARTENATARRRFCSATRRARASNMEFTITLDEYTEMLKCPCQYCGCELNPTGSGLDRINPTIGYTKENSVPCCFQCNWIKSDYFTFDEKIAIGEVVGRIKRQRAHDQGELVGVPDPVDYAT